MKRYRIKFSKSHSLRFLGHLDTLALFQKVIIMVRLPIVYSKGKTPHPKTLFASPLSLGISSKSEYLDIAMKKETTREQILEMNNFLPDGLRILDLRELNENEAFASKETKASVYEIHLPKIDDIDSIENLKKDEILIEKQSKKQKTIEIINIKPLIYHYSISGNILTVTLSTGRDNLRPMEITKYLNIEKTKYVRCDILKQKSGRLISLWEE